MTLEYTQVTEIEFIQNDSCLHTGWNKLSELTAVTSCPFLDCQCTQIIETK